MNIDFKNLARNVLENAVAGAVVAASGVGDNLNFGNSEIGISLKNGAVMTGSEQLLEMYNTGNSKFNRQDWFGLVDDVVYNGSVFWAMNKTNIGANLVNQVNDISPLDRRYNEMLVSGAIMAGAATLKDVVNTSPMYNTTPLRYLTQPTKLLMN